MGVTTRTMVLTQLSPISMAVVSQDAFILDREFFIIRYGVEKKCTTLQMMMRKNVFCSGVPEKHEQEGQTDDHARDGVGHKGDALDDPF